MFRGVLGISQNFWTLRVQRPKYDSRNLKDYGIWSLKPVYSGVWTLQKLHLVLPKLN